MWVKKNYNCTYNGIIFTYITQPCYQAVRGFTQNTTQYTKQHNIVILKLIINLVIHPLIRAIKLSTLYLHMYLFLKVCYWKGWTKGQLKVLPKMHGFHNHIHKLPKICPDLFILSHASVDGRIIREFLKYNHIWADHGRLVAAETQSGEHMHHADP